MTTEQLCNELPSWHCGLKQSSNHLVKDRWKITTVSALLASKIFLARIWQKMDACTQKVWNNRMSSLKSYCSHFCHSPYKSLYHIAYACPSHKTTPPRFSVFVTESETRSFLSKENQSQSASVCLYVCIFSRSLKILWDPLPWRQMNP